MKFITLVEFCWVLFLSIAVGSTVLGLIGAILQALHQ
jgi:hypothetical protein